MQAEDYQARRDELAGWAVTITSYRIADVFHCVIDNIDPGARIARGEGQTKTEAEANAIEVASRRLGMTRRFS
jgi:hypothetical protein